MARVDTWMPLYIGDYLADTMHLTAEEHGAYLLLIMQYFRNGPLPADDRDLARMAKVEPAVWDASVGKRVRAFFRLRNNRLHHRRCDAERARAENNSKKRAISGRIGGQAKSLNAKRDQHVAGNSHDLASDLLKQKATPSPSPSPSEVEREVNKPSKQEARAPALRAVGLPDWMPAGAWDVYAQMRQRIRKPMDVSTANLVIRKLDGFRQRGIDVTEVLEASTMSSWAGVFEPKGGGKPREPTHVADATRRRLERQAKALLDDIEGAPVGDVTWN